jgi:hypothetical protein
VIKLTKLHSFSEPFLSAASGLALARDHFYVIADDELFALKIDKNNFANTQKITLFSGVLSEEKKLRKKTKPDLESIVELPSGDLLCIPSGSEEHRVLGALIKNDGAAVISFQTLYIKLREIFTELNIEGSVVVGHSLRLFQRGNGEKHENATVDVNLVDFLQGLISITNIQRYSLGELNGAALSFTDATLYNDRIYFLAAAEASESTYLDGEFKGAVLGMMDLSGRMLKQEVLDVRSKPEGLSLEQDYFFIVTDDDDRSKPSFLLRGSLPF